MAYNNDRWATAVYTERMFVESEFNRVRFEENEEDVTVAEYRSSKLIPSFPRWWWGAPLDTTKEPAVMHRHFLDPSVQQLGSLYRMMESPVFFPRFPQVVNTSDLSPNDLSYRTIRKFKGMPVLNSVTVGQPVTKMTKSFISTNRTDRFADLLNFTSDKLQVMSYTLEDRFVEPLLPLIAHYYYEVLNGPDYFHTRKRDRVRDSLLCLGNLKSHHTKWKPIIDKITMDYIYSGREIPENLELTIVEVPSESFDYDLVKVRDKMMSSPLDIASVTRFFTSVAIVVNVMTSKEVRHRKRNVTKPLFATRVATLFETIEDRTSTLHRENIALYGELFYI